tara:strand:- start:382 stop:2064 length:1683 start_codon:yes stop_codon:yes gene_type:complete
MGATYTRQSSYTDGDVITAAHTNDEFNQLLAAFQATTGHTHDGTANEGGPISKLLDNTLTFGAGTAGTDITITFDGETSDGVLKWMEDEDYFEFSDDILIASTEKLQFRDTAIYINSSTDGQLDIVADTEIQLAATTVDLNGNLDVSGSLTLGGTAITATGAELNILDGVTSTASELNLVDGITAGTVSASKAVIVDSNKDISGFRNLSITGDLTVAGDDITMGTNTAGNLLVADGTNFNSIAVGDLSEISSVANDDVFVAVDTSGGGLKKITRSAIVAGLATSGAISNVSEDSTPQLGGNLDLNGNDIVTTSNADIELAANGTGHVVIKGNTNQGKITLNCESNSHGQSIQAQAHDLGITNVMLLPKDGNSTLVSEIATQTLTNKTLTSPKINEDVAVTATATEINILDGVTSSTAELNILDGVTSTASELNILDGVTSTASELNLVDGSSAGTIVNSKAVIYGSSGEVNATTLQIAGTSITSTAAELNILDGATATATELNIMDGDTSASSTTLVDADRVVTNDNGTMKQVALSDVKTYLTSAGFSSEDPTALAIALG